MVCVIVISACVKVSGKFSTGKRKQIYRTIGLVMKEENIFEAISGSDSLRKLFPTPNHGEMTLLIAPLLVPTHVIFLLQSISNSDCWLNDVHWTRKHFKTRNVLFTPMKVAMGPKFSKDVGDLRITDGVTLSGERFFRRELWKDSANPHERVEPFHGYTTFINLPLTGMCDFAAPGLDRAL